MWFLNEWCAIAIAFLFYLFILYVIMYSKIILENKYYLDSNKI